MKPLNLDNRPCSPISSNCVIWQGPDIPCIKLCTGDTVSDVIFKLATELCAIMDTLDIKNYDLSCFNLAVCPPDTFQELIQFLIDQICELQGLTPGTDGTKATCPDCVVTVAPCLRETDSSLPATMQLLDYVQLLANKICALIDQVSIINTQITNLDNRVTILEDTPPPTFTIPSIETGCLISYIPGTPASTTIDVILNVLLNNNTIGYCALIDATGLPAEILSAVASQLSCIDGASDSLASMAAGDSPVLPMGTEYFGTWINSPVTAADAITNLWIALCDIRAAITDSGTTVVAAGEGITVTSATVGTVTTYTVINDYLEVFTANVTINDDFVPASGIIPKVVPSSVNGVEDGQVIFRYTSVLSNDQLVVAGTGAFVPNGSLPPLTFGSFDNTTGLFTITDPGTYLIKATIHLKPDSGSTVFWSGETTYSTPPTVAELRDNFKAIGSFYIGIHPNNNTDTFVASSQTMTPSIDKNVEISTSKVITATNPTTLRLKVLNTTNRDYNGTTYNGSDGISFSIVKLRSGLTITNL